MPKWDRRQLDDAIDALRRRARKMWDLAELTKIDLTHWVWSPEKMLGTVVDDEIHGEAAVTEREALVDAMRTLRTAQHNYAAALHDRAVDLGRHL